MGDRGDTGDTPRRLGPLGLPRPPLWSQGQFVRLIGLFAIAVAATVISFAVVSHIGGPSLLPGGAAAPAIALQDAAAMPHKLYADTAGEPVVLEFFETTCAVCQREVVPMCDAHRRHPQAAFFGIDAARETADAVRNFAASQGGGCIAWPLLLDPKSAVLRAYRVTVVPTVYVIDASGRVAYTGTGEAGVAGLGNALALLASHG